MWSSRNFSLPTSAPSIPTPMLAQSPKPRFALYQSYSRLFLIRHAPQIVSSALPQLPSEFPCRIFSPIASDTLATEADDSFTLLRNARTRWRVQSRRENCFVCHCAFLCQRLGKIRTAARALNDFHLCWGGFHLCRCAHDYAFHVTIPSLHGKNVSRLKGEGLPDYSRQQLPKMGEAIEI